MSEEYDPPLEIQKKERERFERAKLTTAIKDVISGADPAEVVKRFPRDPRVEKSENDRMLIAEAEMLLSDVRHANHPITKQQAVERFSKFMEKTKEQRKNLHYGLDQDWKRKLRDDKK
jgi:hypothetical protein